MLYFITGNKNKYEEVRAFFPEVQQLNIDLPEVQDIDPRIIIKTKLDEALKHNTGEFIVEDTSLYLDCLNGLPGPLIKWFLKTMGNEGLFQIADKLGNNKAAAKTIVGYADGNDNIYFFEGVIEGVIVSPRGDTNFGWDPIFQPKGYSKTFAEMSQDAKNEISMRRKAIEQFKEFKSNA